jgi:hypothetical protein
LLSANNEVAAYDPAVREAWGAHQGAFEDNLIETMREEQASGRMAVDIDPVLAARIVVRGGSQVIARQVADSDGTDDADVAQELARAYWFGIYRRPAGFRPDEVQISRAGCG